MKNDWLAATHPSPEGDLAFAPGPNSAQRLAAVQQALAQQRNPFLEAAGVLLRSLAELPRTLPPEGVRGLHTLLVQELQLFTRLCEQANLRRDHMLAVRYALCTALDEAISQKPWAGGEAGNTGIWSTQALLNQFHGESQGGRTVFLLIGRLANAPDEHRDVLEVMHHLLCLGFMGDYRVQDDGHRMIETIRHRLHAMVAAGREPVPPELSGHWRGTGPGRMRLLRSLPVWVSASVLALALFAQFSWYQYGLLTQAEAVRRSIDALASLQPPSSAPGPAAGRSLADALQEPIRQGRLTLDESPQRTLLGLRGEGLFGPGLDTLSPAGLDLLDLLAPLLQQAGGAVRVLGHTDNLAIATPAFPSNQVLSERRAHSVLRALQARGLEPGRLQAQGLADQQPLASNATAAGRAANRRVEIELRPVPATAEPAAAPH